jgi:hypothetical protein
MSHDHPADLPALGHNLVDLVRAMIGTGLSLAAFSLAAPRTTIGILTGRDDECSCVRHHYRCCCEPPCYGCGR